MHCSFNSLRLATDKVTGNSRGFGYLSFEEKEAADSAISSLTGTEVEGRTLKIDLATPRRERTSGLGGSESSGKAPTDSKNSMYVGNLDFSVTASDLLTFCEQELGAGIAKDVRVSFDRETGRSKGFAHIEFSSVDDVSNAISALSGKMLAGRPLRVDIAQSKSSLNSGAGGERPPRRESNFTPRTSSPSAQNSVFLGNLAWNMDEQSIREMVTDYMGDANSFVNVRLAVDRETGRSKGFAHIDFVDAESATKAVELLNGVNAEGRDLRADLAQNKPSTPRFGGGGGGGSYGGREGGGGGRGGGGRGGFRGGDRYGGQDNKSGGNDFGNW